MRGAFNTGMLDLIEGKARIDALRKVVITDLLGRDPVTPILN